MKNENGDSIYHCKDGRLRVYVRETGKTISYPKYLMENELGRELLPSEDVHHIDRDPLNNDLSNLRIMTRSEHCSEHMRKFFDTTATCGWCGREFLWTGKQQETFYSNRRNHGHKSETPFCSRECSGYYGRQQQVASNSCGSKLRKLTDDQVRYVREKHVPYDTKFGSRGLARELNVDKTVIEHIIKGRTYTDII